MEWDLIKTEEQYRKENEKIESKTRELMKKVDDVMKIQDNIINESYHTKRNLLQAKENVKVAALNDKDENGLNCDTMGMSAKNLNHIYRAKLKSIEMEHETLQKEFKLKAAEIKQLQKDNQHNLEEKEKWFSQYNLSKSSVTKLEAQVSVLSSKLQAKECETGALKKEIDSLKKELKTTNINLNATELRLTRVTEENERYKSSLKIAKQDEKELKDSYKKQINEMNVTLKQIEKHKSELIYGFKKQFQLIENLKKQKAHIETFKVTDIAETEFMKILD